MNKEQRLADKQQQQIRHNLFRKLVATARNIISNEVGLPVGCWRINRLIIWLEYSDVKLHFPVFEKYNRAVTAIPTGKERLYCSREALRRYDEDLNQINLRFHDQIIDTCFWIIEGYGKVVDEREIKE